MATVAAALARIKHDLHGHLPPARIEAACRAAGHRWRERKLGPALTLQLFILQVLHGNTAIRHLRHLVCAPLNAAAYCRARMRMPLAALQQLVRDGVTALGRELSREAGEELTRWRGHRTHLIDGTGTITPDGPELRRAFGQPTGRRAGCGLPVPKVLGLFDAMTGLLVEVTAFALFVHEHARAWTLHPMLAAGDLLVGDRGFCSYAHLALLTQRGVLAVFRMHQSQIVSFRPHRRAYERAKAGAGWATQRGRPRSRFVRRLGSHDQLVAWHKPTYKDGPRSWMGQAQFDALPDELTVRELRYQIVQRGHRTRTVTVVTTLLDEKLYANDAVAELYGIRWRVETHWRELKTVLGMRRLRCATEAGVRKELLAYVLVYNLVRAVIVRAAARQGTMPDRVSFTDALRWLLSAAPGDPPIDLVINPARPGRCEPRVVKDYRDTFPTMRRPRRARARFVRTKR